MEINTRKFCRKLCLFIAGMNLLQSLRLMLDSTEYIIGRFQIPDQGVKEFMEKANLYMAISGGVGALLNSLYLVLAAHNLGIGHYNNLMTILTNWLIVLFDVIIVLIFRAGGEAGYLKRFFWAIIVQSFVLGVNECFLFTIDPVNIPSFLFGLSFSCIEVIVYQAAFKSSYALKHNREFYFKLILGQLVLSLVLSVTVAVMCSFCYGGKGLFSVLGIHIITDFILDNSAGRLNTYGKHHPKYKKYLNEEIVNKIKNLEYEIILKFNSNTNYKTTNIVQRKSSKMSDYMDREEKSDSVSSEYRTEEEERNKSKKGKKNRERDLENPEEMDDVLEKVDIEVKVTPLKYENMLEGLEIYRHEVEKDVKLSRICGDIADINLNLYHFKYADIFTMSNLYLINVVTVQFTENASESSRSQSSSESSSDSGPRERENKLRSQSSSKLGVYEMNYYFFVLTGRMYQYKPSKNEWVHPVELLTSLIDLHRHSLSILNMKSKLGIRESLMKCYLEGSRKLSEFQKRVFNREEDSEDITPDNKASKGRKKNKNELGHFELFNDVDLELRKKLVLLFLNNKLRYALLGSKYPLLLNVLTMGLLFCTFPIMGIFDNLEIKNARRLDMIVRIVLLFPTAFAFLVCSFQFLNHLSLQSSWSHNYFYFYLSLLAYLVLCLVGLLVNKVPSMAHLAKNNVFVVVVTLLITTFFQLNVVFSLISLMFQKSGKQDHLTLNYVENNIKTNNQLMAFNLFLYHLIRLVYLPIYRNHSNCLFKLLYWII